MNLCTARDKHAPSCFIGKTCTKLGIDYIGISAEDMQWKWLNTWSSCSIYLGKNRAENWSSNIVAVFSDVIKKFAAGIPVS